MLNKQASETIKTLIQEELELANEKFGPFINRYDGFGKLYEEYDEAKEQWVRVQFEKDRLIQVIRQGHGRDTGIVEYHAQLMYDRCTLVIEELCQLAAMAAKFKQLERGEGNG